MRARLVCISERVNSMNSVKTVLLLGLLSGILLLGGEALGGTRGLEYGLMLAIGMNFFSYFFSDKMALMSYSAQAVTPEESPEIYRPAGADRARSDAEDGSADAQVVGDSRGFAERVSPRAAIRSMHRWRSPKASCG